MKYTYVYGLSVHHIKANQQVFKNLSLLIMLTEWMRWRVGLVPEIKNLIRHTEA